MPTAQAVEHALATAPKFDEVGLHLQRLLQEEFYRWFLVVAGFLEGSGGVPHKTAKARDYGIRPREHRSELTVSGAQVRIRSACARPCTRYLLCCNTVCSSEGSALTVYTKFERSGATRLFRRS
jgi:hypothetical protein